MTPDRRNANGGSSPFTLLGPYTVTHSNVDPVNWYDLGALDDGTASIDSPPPSA
jgi:hypothetical protein